MLVSGIQYLPGYTLVRTLMEDAVGLLSEYVRIRTDQPSPKYGEAINFLFNVGDRLFGSDCIVNVVEHVKDKPNLILTIKGESTRTILLSSHMDVVPVEREKWSDDPFSGAIKEDCIYGRGSQDMKCVGIAYLMAVKRLIAKSERLKKTVKFVFTVDEEIGSADGMELLVKNDDIVKENVDICLDEGAPSPFPFIGVFNGERFVYCITITITGQAGHASAFLSGTVGEKLARIMPRIYETREKEMQKMAGDVTQIGSVMTINLTRLGGGLAFNVVPGEIQVDLSIRVPPTVSIEELKVVIDGWLEGVEGASWETTVASEPAPLTPLDNPYFVKLRSIIENEFSTDTRSFIFPGASDSRFLRSAGVPTINVTPVVGCPLLMHDHDEHIPIHAYLRSIDIYEHVIEAFMDM